MGWPQFQKCCGCLSLTTGTIVIGVWTIILSVISGLIHLILLVLAIQFVQNNPEEWASVLQFFLASIAIIIDLIQCILGILLIAFRKNAKYLGKLVFYMIVLCLINLLVILVSVSTDSSAQHYFSAALIVLDGYFILIVRSNQLQLEGRLTNPVDVRRRRSLELGGLTTAGSAYQNNTYPPPPPYEEAIRYGALYRRDIAATLSPTEEIPNSIRSHADLEPNQLSPSLSVETHPVESSSSTENAKKCSPKEPDCIIYDERQFTAISAGQVVERSVVSNTI